MSRITTATQAIAFATEVETSAALYAALLSSDDDYWSGWGTETKDNLDTLNRLALEQNRPMLLAVLQYFNKQEVKKVLRLSVNWGVRGLIVGGIGGGSTETAYCNAAMAVRSGEVKTAASLLSKLESIVPNDKEFEAAFSTARVTKVALSRYYLRALEAYEAGDAEPEFVANKDEAAVNLEHVLPKNATDKEWPEFPGELKKQWVDRIGNHALLQKTPNSKIGNKPFAFKKPRLALSSFKLTKQVSEEFAWTPESIEKRQAELASKVPFVWPRAI